MKTEGELLRQLDEGIRMAEAAAKQLAQAQGRSAWLQVAEKMHNMRSVTGTLRTMSDLKERARAN